MSALKRRFAHAILCINGLEFKAFKQNAQKEHTKAGKSQQDHQEKGLSALNLLLFYSFIIFEPDVWGLNPLLSKLLRFKT